MYDLYYNQDPELAMPHISCLNWVNWYLKRKFDNNPNVIKVGTLDIPVWAFPFSNYRLGQSHVIIQAQSLRPTEGIDFNSPFLTGKLYLAEHEVPRRERTYERWIELTAETRPPLVRNKYSATTEIGEVTELPLNLFARARLPEKCLWGPLIVKGLDITRKPPRLSPYSR